MSTIEVIPELHVKADDPRSSARGPSGARPSARKCVPYLVFALCVSLYFLPFMRLLLRGTDEGLLVERAVRTFHGQLLGRDFFEVMGPGTFYWLALFFKLFGVTFLASRICLFVSSLGTAVSLYFLSRRVCRSYQLLPCILVFATYFGTFWPEISHHVDSNCFALLSVVCMVLWHDYHKNWLLAAAGALAGATTLFLQTKGLLLLLAFFVWLGIKQYRRSASLSALVWVTGGCLGVVALMLGYFWTQGALGDLIYANVVWPSRNYGPAFSVHYASFILDYFNHWVVPMQGINWTLGMAAVLVIPFLFVAALPVLVLCLGIGHGIKDMRPEIVLYWLAGSAFWLSEIHRKDIGHLVFGAPLLIILCVYYLQQSDRRLARLVIQSLLVSSVCLAAATLVLASYAHPTQTRVGQVSMAAYDPVLTAIDDHVPPGGEIFIYPYGAMYYFLSATTNPTPYAVVYYNFKIGPRSVFDDVMWKLEQHKVRYVLWDSSVQDKLKILFPGSGLKQHIIESYLESHYKSIWTHDGTFLMERKSDDHANE
jgi:Dolichyl-phosphate-mannose-protein mannosyltransferase